MARIVDKEAKKQQIIDAALDLFLDKGYRVVTTREIAAKAGISKGALYDYFRNKEDLFYETCRNSMMRKFDIATKTGSQLTQFPPIERYFKLKEMWLKHAEARKKRHLLMSDFFLNCPDENFKYEVFAQLNRIGTDLAKNVVTEAFPELDTDPEFMEAVISIFMAFSDGLMYQYYPVENNEVTQKTIDVFWEMMTNAITSRTNTDTQPE